MFVVKIDCSDIRISKWPSKYLQVMIGNQMSILANNTYVTFEKDRREGQTETKSLESEPMTLKTQTLHQII